ncbi:MAG: NUDIX hydrolase [Beijerinckiaceae bacterium]
MRPVILPPRPLIAASVGVFREGRVLIAERIVEPAKGLFTFPGGKLEMGETLAECALRELREEVSVSARIVGFVDHVETIVRDPAGNVTFHALICAFAAVWLEGEAQSSSEIGQTVWARPDDIGRWPTTKGLSGIVAKARTIVEQAA